MFWETIDALRAESLAARARELQSVVEAFSNESLILFHKQAVPDFKIAFNPQTYLLYCAVYEGEVNGSGFIDFCSNIMLAGSAVFNGVSQYPDQFYAIENTAQFNDDYGIQVAELGREILIARLGDEVVEAMVARGDIPTLDGIWDDLEALIGTLNFEPDWTAIRETMPNVFLRWRT